MSDLVDPTEIEHRVGRRRHTTLHYGRADYETSQVYVLHSEECRSSTPDLRDCEYSIALDRGIEAFYPWLFWSTRQDQTVPLTIGKGWLIPDLPALERERRRAEEDPQHG